MHSDGVVVGAGGGTSPHYVEDSRAGEGARSTETAAKAKKNSRLRWRLRDRFDRRSLAILDVRPSMLRDHGFDRYDTALRALLHGSTTTGG